MWYTGRVTEQYKRKPNTICLICKKPVYKRPVEIKRNSGKVYCSIICYGIACRKEKPCTVCGKMILSSLNKKTCGRACANKQRTGIKYHLGRPKDKVISQRILKVRLMKERGTVCERCRYSVYQILQVHHKDRNRKNNTMENLELICPNCHFAEHYKRKSWLKIQRVHGEVG